MHCVVVAIVVRQTHVDFHKGAIDCQGDTEYM